MKSLSEEDKKQIIEKLSEKGVKNICPMCGNKNFIIADGYIKNVIQPQLKGMLIGGPSIPTVPIICTNCGFLSEHALGVIGLLSKGDDAKK